MQKAKMLKVLAIVVAVATAIVALLELENGLALIGIGAGAAVVASVGYCYSTPADITKVGKHLTLSVPVALIMVAAGYPFDLTSAQVAVQQFAGMVVVLFVPAEILERKLFGVK